MMQILCADISPIGEPPYQMLYRAASPERRQRADKFRNFEDSLRCIVAEHLLRTALKRTFGHWEGFSISKTEYGKPYLIDREDFHFSISHSGSWVVLAYGKSEVGIDIQKISAEKARSSVAKRFFTLEEQSWLIQQNNYAAAFTQIWTGKESYLKYLGTGLSKSLTSFSVLSPEEEIHYLWKTLDDHILCLCSRETNYRTEHIDIKNAPA